MQSRMRSNNISDEPVRRSDDNEVNYNEEFCNICSASTAAEVGCDAVDDNRPSTILVGGHDTGGHHTVGGGGTDETRMAIMATFAILSDMLTVMKEQTKSMVSAVAVLF